MSSSSLCAPWETTTSGSGNIDVFFSSLADCRSLVELLYADLKVYGLRSFKYDVIGIVDLESDRSFRPLIFKAIEQSRISIVVLSKNYAYSERCLEELVKIMECREKIGQIVIPILYDMDPSILAEVEGTLRTRYRDFKLEMVERWGKALKQISQLPGWTLSNRIEAACIRDIVRDLLKLKFASLCHASAFVGMDSHCVEMNQLLRLGCNDVRTVGIWGMGGTGKTTIARVVYSSLIGQFEYGYFLESVKDKFEKHGANVFREELVSIIARKLRATAGPTKVLLVLDDVDNLEQLEVLARYPFWFYPGSRIIITSRDKYLLDRHGINTIYKVKLLEKDQALQLFSRYAFKQEQPKEGYLELSNNVVSFAEGLPLALKVLGSFLYNKSIHEWQNLLNREERSPNLRLNSVLGISYVGLKDREKDVFLAISCFFIGENLNVVTRILSACGYYPHRTLKVLMDKAMITILDGKLCMHKLLQKMGNDILRQKHGEFRKHIGLRKIQDLYLGLTMNMGTKKFENSVGDMGNAIPSVEGFKFLFDGFSDLDPPAYPPACMSKSLPLHIHAEILVELDLPYTNFELLWAGKQHLVNTKLIDLKHSKLTRIPDLSEALKLERLDLLGCTNLVDLSSIQYLTKIEYLNLKGCEKLECFPSMTSLKFLKTLDLSNCSRLKKLPELSRNTTYLYLSETAIQELPSSIGCLSGLIELDLAYCTQLENLPSSICELKSLQILNIFGCSKLLTLLD